jgi:hypothetical protein
MRCGVARYARRDWRRPRDGRADAHGASVKLLAQAQERWGALGQADRRAHRGQACLDRRCRERRDGGKASALGRGDRPSSADTPRRHRRGGCCGHQEDSCDCCPVAGAQARRAGANREAVLRVICERPGVSARELAVASQVTGGTLYTLLRRLVQEGDGRETRAARRTERLRDRGERGLVSRRRCN